eukprot:COSAG06_NODE_964_length_11305_cov_5.854721_3_plen_181_part_00
MENGIALGRTSDILATPDGTSTKPTAVAASQPSLTRLSLQQRRGNLHILACSNGALKRKREHTTRAGRAKRRRRRASAFPPRAVRPRGGSLPPAPPPRARRSGVAARAALVRGGARAGGRAQRAAGCRRRTNCLRPIRRFVKNFRVRMVGAAMVLRKPLRAVKTASATMPTMPTARSMED